jgi:hypothetical protein
MPEPYVPGGTIRYSHTITRAGDPDPYMITGAMQVDEGTVNLPAVATALHTAGKALHAQLGSSVDTMRSTLCRLMLTTGGEEAVAVALGDQAGGSTGATLPANCAVLGHKMTGLAGRHNRGRLYYPGIAEGVVDENGNLASAQITHYNTQFAAYLSAVNGISGIATMVLVHAPRVGNSAPTPTPITSIIVDLRIATQRRRLR